MYQYLLEMATLTLTRGAAALAMIPEVHAVGSSVLFGLHGSDVPWKPITRIPATARRKEYCVPVVQCGVA